MRFKRALNSNTQSYGFSGPYTHHFSEEERNQIKGSNAFNRQWSKFNRIIKQELENKEKQIGHDKDTH